LKMDDTPELVLLRLFRQAAHRLDTTRKYRGQGWLLALLSERGTLTQRQLTEITGRRSATLSEQLKNMEKAGYITRVKNAEDKRNVDVTLTPRGLERAFKVQEERAELAGKLFGTLDDGEKRTLTDIMRKLMPEWKSLTDDGKAVPK
jgi:DNA-binding MarR family transcriptional regulator